MKNLLHQSNSSLPLVVAQAKEAQIFDQKKVARKPILKIFVVFGLLLIIVLGSAYFFFAVPVLSFKKKIPAFATKGKETIAYFQEQKFAQTLEGLNELNNQRKDLEKEYQRLSWLKVVPYFGGFYKDGIHIFAASSHLFQAADTAAEALLPYADIIGLEEKKSSETQLPGQKKELTVEGRLLMVLETINKLVPQFEKIGESLNLAAAEMNQVKVEHYPQEVSGKKVRENVAMAVSTVDSLAKTMAEIKPIASYLEPLLGVPKRKVYFLLFQNDAELRPTGGFMTAYALIAVQNGKFEPLGSYDMYGADNRFGNRLKAPEPILKYLPNVTSWHLRDMNLSPDFVVSMQTFWENFRKVNSVGEVDGIISVDTQVLVGLLKILGQIGVPGWGNFSAENDSRCNCPKVVYELEKFADQPVSTLRTDRKGIIGPLMHSIISNAMGSPRKKWPEFFNLILDQMKGKHLLLYFFDENLQKAIEQLNAAGRIRDYEGDFFLLNDCNFGGAKSNLYITQNVSQKITVEGDGSVVKEVTIDYKNPAPPSDCNLEKGNLCLNGLYRDWFRLYVPKGSQLIESNGSEVEVKTYEDLGKTVFEGFYGFKPETSLKPEGKLKLSFKYRLPFKVADKEEYRLLVQKQPGTKAFDYEIELGNEKESFSLDGDREVKLKIKN